jgi:hypothetical protein
MQIIIKQDLISNTETILNIFYGENDAYIENWINLYFDQEIEKLNMTNLNIKSDSLDYFVEIKDTKYYLVKKYKLILKGYIYNSAEKVSEKLFSIRCLSYDNINPLLSTVESQSLWNGINSEITHRIMKQVNKDTLYQINMTFEAAVKTKETWNSTELVMLQNEVTRTHKKKLYNSIVKKMKKFEKKQTTKSMSSPQNLQTMTLPCKTIMAEGSPLRGVGSAIPDISRYTDSCEHEYHVINNKEKFD